jgi:hypothetical protein
VVLEPLSSGGWFESFRTAYRSQEKDPESDISLSQDTSDYSAEWTAVMGLFLGKLARQSGFKQKWELPIEVGKPRPRKLDFGWYDSTGERTVAIEHHSWFSDGPGFKDKIITVLLARSPLGVLITYTPRQGSRTRDRVVAESESMLRAASPGTIQEFLILLGDAQVSSVESWCGYGWDGSERKLNSL